MKFRSVYLNIHTDILLHQFLYWQSVIGQEQFPVFGWPVGTTRSIMSTKKYLSFFRRVAFCMYLILLRNPIWFGCINWVRATTYENAPFILSRKSFKTDSVKVFASPHPFSTLYVPILIPFSIKKSRWRIFFISTGNLTSNKDEVIAFYHEFDPAGLDYFWN